MANGRGRFLKAVGAILACVVVVGCSYEATKRERARVTFMLGHAQEVEKLINDYYLATKAFPQSSSVLKLPQRIAIGSNPPVDGEDPGLVAFSQEIANGRILLVFEQMQGEVSGKSIVFAPSVDAQGSTSWSCTGGTLDETYRPMHCRVSTK